MRTASDVVDRMKEALGIKQDSDLARRFGIAKTTVSGWRGRNAVPYELCVLVSDEAGASLDWLLAGEGPRWRVAEQAPPGGGYEAKLSQGEKAVLNLYRALEPDAQREIQTVADEKRRLREIERKLQELQADLASSKRSP